MFKFTILTALSVLLLPVLVASLPHDSPLEKRSYSGTATQYYPREVACGSGAGDTPAAVALPKALYDSTRCKQGVTITNTNNGNKAYGIVVDECTTCGPSDLDVTSFLFAELAPGQSFTEPIPISWAFA